MRLHFLRTYHHATVRSGDTRLREAMVEYQQSFAALQERQNG